MSVFRLFSFSNNSVKSCRNLLCSSFLEQRALISGKTIKQLGIPTPPKRPCTPYIRFFQNIRPKIKENNPDLNPKELVKVVAQEWAKYDPEKKKLLQKEFLSELEVYLKNFEAYKQSITPEQQNLINSTKEKEKQAKEQARIHSKKESLGKPKKPPTGFLKFLMERKSQKDESLKYTDWVRQLAREWEMIPEERKDQYKEETKIALDKYKSDMLAWEESMIRQGHIDVVRNKELLEISSTKKQSSKTTA
ncbi:transcription factor A, mitochondrial [Nasonia vitripennis]|uniref:HMG box domain-containing protein n=1 Tax=Nasonia vitripennis TaxID=7425 RepID=A0A7M7G3S8_NASVI|nr:transcription factor A, mitochondrial [Nasonia vitripennis]